MTLLFSENVDLTGDTDYLLDGVDTSFMALVNDDETFSVAVEFDEDLVVEDDATVDGLVDGVDILEVRLTDFFYLWRGSHCN